MAKNRYVNTKFWTDPYVLEKLNPLDKLLYLYLMTNPYTDISGVYELPLKIASVELGIDRENLENVMLPKLEADGKIMYRDGWVAIKNFIKHQKHNPKVVRGIELGLERAPKELRLFIGYDNLSHTNTNYNTNTNTNINTNTTSTAKAGAKPKTVKPKPVKEKKPAPKAEYAEGYEVDSVLVSELIKLFESVDPKNKTYYGNTSQRKACAFVIGEYGFEEVKKRVAFLPRTNKQPYFPSITTPVQLRDKWVNLEDAVERYKKEHSKASSVAF